MYVSPGGDAIGLRSGVKVLIYMFLEVGGSNLRPTSPSNLHTLQP